MTRLIVFLILALATPAFAEEPKINYEKFELANGLKVYVIEDHKAPTVYEVLWFQVGSKDEVANRTGFAHLFEHLMFKGSTHLPDGLMDRLLEGAGGWSNAFTSSDMTVYQNVAGSNFLEQMLWMEADRFVGLLDTFDQAKLDNQRDVVLNERRQSYENRPYGMSGLLIQEALWPKGHGYHWSTIGYVPDLQAAAVPDVAAFFKKYYVPNNATLVIAGDVKVDNVKKLVEKYFGWIPRAPAPARPHYKTPAPITKEIVINTTDDVQVPRVYLAWRGPAGFTAEEPALDAAAAILGEGKSSRLYKRLVYDEKIAQDVSAGFHGKTLAGTFQIVVTAKPGVDPQRLIKEITEEVAKISATAPDAKELERAQNSQEASFLAGLEPTLQRAILLASYDVLAKDPDYFSKDLSRRRAVTTDQVRAVAAKYLAPSARVTLTIRPGKKPAEKPATKPATKPAPTPAKQEKK
ncbi:MAG: insulinase family protein [Deltaproteobacteria bacterium]|nr:insulinase family protein [Deltaproteobacteria bacterium]MDQ3298749.1 insulinase family protein [Myxococcota bacterium]